jgi:hypothetical protein
VVANVYWSVQLQDAHLSRDPSFYTRLLAAFVAFREQPRALTKTELATVENQMELGQYGRLIVGAEGTFLFLNRADPCISSAEQQAVVTQYQSTCRYVFLNALLQKAVLDDLVAQLATTTSTGLDSRRLPDRLEALREQAMDSINRTVSYQLSMEPIGEELWQRLGTLLQLRETRERVLESIKDLAEYIAERRTAKLDKLFLVLSILIGPFTLLTDYLGGLLSSTYQKASHFVTVVGITYGTAITVSAIVYLLFLRRPRRPDSDE